MIYKSPQDLDRAISCFKEALKISTEHSSSVHLTDRERASLFYTLGVSLAQKRELKEGLDHFNRALEIAQTGQIDPVLIAKIKGSVENVEKLLSRGTL